MIDEWDRKFMSEALKEAQKAFASEEVPVGAVLVLNRKVISRGHNQVEMLKDATAHAEMICLTSASQYFNDWRLVDTVMYTTLEPCAMCLGAILLSRVKKLVWAAPDKRVGANGSWIDLLSFQHPIHQLEVVKHVMEEEAGYLMKTFFEMRRKNKKGL